VRRRRAAGIETPPPVALTAAVDPSRRLSEGALIQASVHARLFGIPLLRLDATVVLMPSAIKAPSSVVAEGNGLAEAVRSINDGAEVLAQVRRNGRRRVELTNQLKPAPRRRNVGSARGRGDGQRGWAASGRDVNTLAHL
jgi:hypothetical protein